MQFKNFRAIYIVVAMLMPIPALSEFTNIEPYIEPKGEETPVSVYEEDGDTVNNPAENVDIQDSGQKEPVISKKELRQQALDNAKRDRLLAHAKYINAPWNAKNKTVSKSAIKAHAKLLELRDTVDNIRYGAQLIGEMYGYCAPVVHCNQDYNMSNDGRQGQMKWLDYLNFISPKLSDTNKYQNILLSPIEEQNRAKEFLYWTYKLVLAADHAHSVLKKTFIYPVVYSLQMKFTKSSARDISDWADTVYKEQVKLVISYTDEGAEKEYRDTLVNIDAKYNLEIAKINASDAPEEPEAPPTDNYMQGADKLPLWGRI